MVGHLRTPLVVDAPEMAVTHRRPGAVIRHSDLGCQHTSPAFGARCRERGIARSMIQWIKRLGRGCRNRERFRNASCFHLGGLDVHPDAVGTHTKS